MLLLHVGDGASNLEDSTLVVLLLVEPHLASCGCGAAGGERGGHARGDCVKLTLPTADQLFFGPGK